MKKLDQKGFTLLELLLAMTVFIAVTLIATVGFIGINKTAARGIIKKQLSEAIQISTEDIAKTIREKSNQPPIYCAAFSTANGCVHRNYSRLCFKEARYFWGNDATGYYGIYGLFKDSKSCDEDPSPNNQVSTRLMSDRFKVIDQIKVEPVRANIYRITGAYATTSNDALLFPTDIEDVKCKGTAQSGLVATCAVEKFNFVVSGRLRGVE